MSTTDLPDDLRRSSAHVLVDRLDDLESAHLAVSDDVEHHLVRVLRLQTGESITATDGAGSWRCYTTAVMSSSARFEATSDVRRLDRSGPVRTIASAIPKGDRVDWLVQKCTELGADRIVLLHAERSVVRWKAARAGKQIERLQRISDEALRQSRRVWRVAIDGPIDAFELLADAAVAEPGGRPLASTDSVIAIGPEGGWSETELAHAADRIDLGNRILRTETAAIAATILSQ